MELLYRINKIIYVKYLAQILKMLALILKVFMNDERREGN